MIMNAAEPVIDYAYLHKPTATISSYPPSAAPAPRLQSPQGGGGGGSGHYIQNLNNLHRERSMSAFSSWWLSSVMSSPVSFIRHLSRFRSSSSSPSSTAEIDFDEISTDFYTEELQQQEKRPPSRSRYSPPAAAYYVEDESIRQHHIYLQQQHERQQQQQRHSTHPSFNGKIDRILAPVLQYQSTPQSSLSLSLSLGETTRTLLRGPIFFVLFLGS